MDRLELIVRLCDICEMQAAIIREQATFIEEQLSVDEAIKKRYADKRAAVNERIDWLELHISKD